MMLINGKQQTRIEANDRGLTYGDGLFETLEIKSGKPVYWRRHLHRLQQGCDALDFDCPDEAVLLQECRQVAKDADKGIVKVILTRSGGGRGYRPENNRNPHRIISFHTWPDLPDSYYTNGIALYLCDTPVSVNNKLAGIKTLCRLEQVLAQSEWDEQSFAEGVMLDNKGLVIEGSKSNIFTVCQGNLYTPSLAHAGIHGIMRSIVIEAAQRLGLPVLVQDITTDDLQKADEIFVCNSIIKIWPVREYQDREYKPGDITQMLSLEIKQQSSFYE